MQACPSIKRSFTRKEWEPLPPPEYPSTLFTQSRGVVWTGQWIMILQALPQHIAEKKSGV